MKKFLSIALVLCSALLVGCKKDEPVPAQEKADYTMMVYSMLGGTMDYLIEDVWEETQQLLPDQKVRVVWMHKYGKPEGFRAEYGQPGKVVMFELTKDTKFEDVIKAGKIDTALALYDPQNITVFINRAAEMAPAKEYVLAIFGHGGGFYPGLDYPKEWANDGAAAPRKVKNGIVSDEWQPGSLTMNMYELSEGITNSQIKHFKSIVFHNCLTGGMESLQQVKSYADYLFASPFMMTSEDNPLIPVLVKNMRAKADFETAARQTVVECQPRLVNGFQHETPDNLNGNQELIKTSELDAVCSVTKKLSERLCEIYATQQAAIDTATNHVYRFANGYPYFDLLDYAQCVAKETKNEQLQAISQELEQAFQRAIIEQVTVDLKAHPAMPSYSLSVFLRSSAKYNQTVPNREFTMKQAYEYSAFHKATGWGDWVNMNQQEPTGNPCGQVL